MPQPLFSLCTRPNPTKPRGILSPGAATNRSLPWPSGAATTRKATRTSTSPSSCTTWILSAESLRLAPPRPAGFHRVGSVFGGGGRGTRDTTSNTEKGERKRERDARKYIHTLNTKARPPPKRTEKEKRDKLQTQRLGRVESNRVNEGHHTCEMKGK